MGDAKVSGSAVQGLDGVQADADYSSGGLEQKIQQKTAVSINRGREGSSTRISIRSPRRRSQKVGRDRFTIEENRLLTKLKTFPDLTWREIYQRFNEEFPGRRSLGSLQVHYSTALRTRSGV